MSQPNIILIVTDQQRYDTINALGFPYMQTPHLDRLVQEGVSFDSAFCSAPSCVPSRASFFNACYPHEIGVYGNRDQWDTSWVSQLQEAGYHTVNIGKMHTNPVEAPCGFDQRIIVENPDRPFDFTRPHGVYYDDWDLFLNASDISKPSRVSYKAEHPDYETALGAYAWQLESKYHPDVFVGDTAEWFLDKREASSPLFMMIGFPGPHPPYSPTQQFIDQYANTTIPIPDVTDAELEGQPPPHTTYRKSMIEGNHDAVRWRESPTYEQLLRLRRYYAAYVSLIDEQVGRVMEKLLQKGYVDNTIVIFTSDHGDSLGDHGHIQKWMMYDCNTHVPMVVWSPEHLPSGYRSPALIQQMDIVPMLFEMADMAYQGDHSARSVLPLIQGKESIREAVFAEHGPTNQISDINLLTMLRTTEWKLVHYFDQDWGELYNLHDNPEETHNLWYSPSHRAVRDEFETTLLNWRVRTTLS